MGLRLRRSVSTSRNGAAHVAFGTYDCFGLCDFMAFEAQSHTPADRCLRFAAAVTDDHATLATGRRATALYSCRSFTGWTAPASPDAPQATLRQIRIPDNANERPASVAPPAWPRPRRARIERAAGAGQPPIYAKNPANRNSRDLISRPGSADYSSRKTIRRCNEHQPSEQGCCWRNRERRGREEWRWPDRR